MKRMCFTGGVVVALCVVAFVISGCSQAESRIVYSPVVVEVGQGLETTTAPPDMEGGAISEFSIESAGVDGIDIDPVTGAITVSSTVGLGAYRIDVGATSEDGKSVYKDAMVVFVMPPQLSAESVTYTQSPLSMVTGVSYISDAPRISDLAGDLQFSLTGSQEAWLSIDSETGVLQADDTATPGVYEIPITVSNQVGEVTIDDAVVINVRAFVTFNDDIRPIVLRRCAPCHTFGTGTENLTVYETAAKKPDRIITRITLPLSDRRFMPPGGPRLDDVEITLFERWNDEGLLRE